MRLLTTTTRTRKTRPFRVTDGCRRPAAPAPRPGSPASGACVATAAGSLHGKIRMHAIVATVPRRGLRRAMTAALGLAMAASALTAQAPDDVTLLPATPPAGAAADGEMRLVANIPAFRLDVYRGDRVEHSYRITVGKRGFETPSGVYRIGHVIWNPWWHPPQSDWARGRTPERPGPNNPMGRAKLHFAELLYLHGTPNTAALGGSGSHGCVRLANVDVLDLARRVQEYAAPEFDSEVDALLDNPGRTRRMEMARAVTLEIRYDLAEVRDGRLELHPDVYGLGRPSATRAEMVHALLRAGVDLVTVDAAQLDRLAAGPRRGVRQVALTELTVPATAAAAMPPVTVAVR